MKKIFRRLNVLFALMLFWQGATFAQMETIQQGTILHCFDWKYTDIQASLQSIKDAGFTAVQTSPAQSNYTGSTAWSTLYRPRDTEIGSNSIGTKAELQALCNAAHAMGIKVIVDVVANHTDGSLNWVADYWKNTDLYHTLGSVSNWNDRYQVINGEIGMKDLKTEDPRVQEKFKTYVQALKAVGVDGIRWDAAKHIGLPSEGDNFWKVVIDKDMFNYGEILDNTGGDDSKLIPEYMQYMSVTDSPYLAPTTFWARQRMDRLLLMAMETMQCHIIPTKLSIGARAMTPIVITVVPLTVSHSRLSTEPMPWQRAITIYRLFTSRVRMTTVLPTVRQHRSHRRGRRTLQQKRWQR